MVWVTPALGFKEALRGGLGWKVCAVAVEKNAGRHAERERPSDTGPNQRQRHPWCDAQMPLRAQKTAHAVPQPLHQEKGTAAGLIVGEQSAAPGRRVPGIVR